IVLQADGKIILVSSLSSSFLMARLNSDGSMDNSFSVFITGFYDNVGSLVLDPSFSAVIPQPDGKLLVFGAFSAVRNVSGAMVARSCFARLNSDGSLDESFNPGSGFAIGHNNGYSTPAVD